jgi:hopanoid biosynthesis associated RND transporter like protein HpnN
MEANWPMTEPSPAEHAFVPRLLVWFVDACCRRPWAVGVVSLAVAVISATVFYTRLEYRTQRSDLMSPHKDYQERWRAYLKEFGDDDDMVVVVEGSDRDRMTAALEYLAGEVQARPGQFERLFYKVDLRHLRDRALLFLPAEQIRSIHDNLQRMGMLLFGPTASLAWQNVTIRSLLAEARARAGKIDPSAPLAAADEQFLTQLLAVVRSASAFLTDAAKYRNPWDSLLPQQPQQADLLAAPQYFFSGEGGLAFLLVRPVKEAESFTPALASVQALRGLVVEARGRFPDLKLGLTGMPVLETDEMEASQRDSNLAGYLALGGVALLYMLVYRGIRYPLITVVTLLVGTLWSMGWLTLTVGHLNILSASFAVMLIGMGDYGVLWVTHYDDERRAGHAVRPAILRTAAEVGPSVLTAGLTTALAFFAAMLADFQAVAELGWIAGSGVLLCAFACFTVLPAMLCVTDRRGALSPAQSIITADGERMTDARVTPLETQSRAWLPALSRRPRLVLAVGLAGIVVLAVFAMRVRYDHNLLNLQNQKLESVRWERKLIDRTAGASWCALSIASTPAEARALKSRYEALPEVSRVVEVASLVPADQEQKLWLVREVRAALRGLPDRGSAITPFAVTPADLQKEITFLIGALEPQAPVSPQPILEQLIRSLAELRDHPGLRDGVPARQRLAAFGRQLTGDLLADLHRLRDVATPAPITLDDLPAALRERYVGTSGKWLVQAYAKDGLWDFAPLEHFVSQVRTVDLQATGKPFGTLEGLRGMQRGFAWAGIYALAVIAVVLWADFRTTRHTLLALAPLVVGAIITLGVMGLLGIPLNPANMIALPLIVGVGVDNGVHVLHDYRSRGRHRSYTLAATTGQGIAVAALTTVLGFGTLMVASHRGLVSLGFVLALGVTACMGAALVLLPAVLRLASRRVPVAAVEKAPRRAA